MYTFTDTQLLPKIFTYLECNAGYGGVAPTGECTACTGDTYKATQGNTDCIDVPSDSQANSDNTAFGMLNVIFKFQWRTQTPLREGALTSDTALFGGNLCENERIPDIPLGCAHRRDPWIRH